MEGMRRPAAAPPEELGARDGLAYALFVPEEQPLGGVVILHGAGSCKENHFDFARALRAAGMAAVAFDQRGHGASDGALDGRAVADVATMASALPPGAPLGLRGSSMGGYLALVAAAQLGAAAVVAICPASADHLARGLSDERFDFRADADRLQAFLAEHPLDAVVPDLAAELLLLHAEGDEQVPVQHSRDLAALADPRRSRYVEVPGGDHRSVQHDSELQALAVRFLAKSFGL
jgi:alpha-beta hydrolase superfamily lysophospholipase